MARTSKSASTIEAKALAADTKSEGMRMLLNDGWKIADVARLFGSPYSFVYGVAFRAGLHTNAAERRAPKATATPKSKSAKAAVAKSAPAKTTGTRTGRATKAAVAAKATTPTKAPRVTQRPGRPTPERRQANRAAGPTKRAAAVQPSTASKVSAVASKVASRRS